jgi:hypothetical protein
MEVIMNKITILALSVLAIGSAEGMYTKKGREIMASQKAQKATLAVDTPANRAKIVLVPVTKPAPACSKAEYYNVRLPLINASKEAKNKLSRYAAQPEIIELKKDKKVHFIPGDVSSISRYNKNGAIAAEQPQEVVQQRTTVGKTVATLTPLAVLGTLIAYDQGLLSNAALVNAVQSIDIARFAAFFRNSVVHPALNAARLAMGYANPAITGAAQFTKENAEYMPVAGLTAYIIAKNQAKLKKDAREAYEPAAEERGYAQLAERAANANELYVSGKTLYNPKNLNVKVVGIKREGNALVLDDKH